ncbi:MAG TPA: ABC transporter ATP-binding protein [Flavisolibacter sp.]|jgi:lipopolysaccharide transport system ATP-binding protein|nr:ABC transporter ATP-binding protein [Flavisolibacter sp.]
MEEIVLSVENLSKQYRLGKIGTGSLRQDLSYWWKHKVLEKSDPFFYADEDERFIWALKDVNFELKSGEALGIIGSNGSGKSTLLKIISKITLPTKGYVRGNGTISSILEIGTGFHPELSGRENIFMSGYALGMTKEEIRKKFDEIVSFSGIEKFIDTPVKRFSSGMYVRLAFSVAAHLEPDILIIDEVLAVGDVEFQKKCMGKMQDVSHQKGRTILFVSHNMTAINNLCSKAIWLEKGILQKNGTAKEVVKSYLEKFAKPNLPKEWVELSAAPGNDMIRLKKTSVEAVEQSFISVATPVKICCEFWCLTEGFSVNINVRLNAEHGECVFDLGSSSVQAQRSIMQLDVVIPARLLNNQTYSVSLTVVKNHAEPIFEFSNCLSLDVQDERQDMNYFGAWPGVTRPVINNNLRIKELLENDQTKKISSWNA